jgi:GT2 family glycosyltransferase
MQPKSSNTDPFPTVRVQSILYNLPLQNIERSLEFIDRSTANARRSGTVERVEVAYGDCSPTCSIDQEQLAELRRRFRNLDAIDYTFFGSNLGSAAGHNRLLQDAKSHFVMILNPDVLVAPNLVQEMISSLGRPGVGLVEARQLPIEHPKYYHPATGETSWASTACALASTELFHRLGGFDSDTFFLYCDDVDFSWRVRLAGHKVILKCSAVVFHDKRLSNEGGWIASDAERYYSAEAGLLLPYKYSRPDLTDKYLQFFSNSEDRILQKVASSFELRRKAGRLPSPIDADHSVAEFVDGNYAHHRFVAT